MDTENIVALVTAIAAFAISLINVILSKKRLSSEIITKNRMDWIAEVRSLVSDFLKIYVENGNNTELKKIRNKISLYMRSGNESYSYLLSQLDYCIASGYDQSSCDEVIRKAQIVFSEVWIRMKREAGITKLMDKMIAAQFKKKKAGNMSIKYDKLLKLLESNGITLYTLKKDNVISHATYKKIKKGGDIDTRTIAKLCKRLNCQPGDLLEYVEEQDNSEVE